MIDRTLDIAPLNGRLLDDYKRQAVRPQYDAYGPRLVPGLSAELYVVISDYRRQRYLGSLPERKKAALKIWEE